MKITSLLTEIKYLLILIAVILLALLTLTAFPILLEGWQKLQQVDEKLLAEVAICLTKTI